MTMNLQLISPTEHEPTSVDAGVLQLDDVVEVPGESPAEWRLAVGFLMQAEHLLPKGPLWRHGAHFENHPYNLQPVACNLQ